MTLGDVFQSTFITNDDTFSVHVSFRGWVKTVRRGNWFQDHILDVSDREIFTLHYLRGPMGNHWDVELVDVEDEP